MKKHLIAAAVAAAVAVPAMAQVTISGRVDASIGYATNEKDNSETRINSSLLTTSQLVITGSEDLGGGLKANMVVQSQLAPDTGTFSWGNRGFTVGLSGAFGAVTIGKDTGSAMDQIGTSATVNNLGNYSVTNNRLSNTISYTTPSMQGFTGRVLYSGGGDDDINAKIADGSLSELDFNLGADARRNKQTELSVAYSNGPLLVRAAHATNKNVVRLKADGSVNAFGTEASAAKYGDRKADKIVEYGIQANYNFGVALVNARYINRDVTGSSGTSGTDYQDESATGLGVSVPLGNGLTANADYLRINSVNNEKDINVSSATLVKELSKRTNVYGAYSLRNLKINTTGGSTAKPEDESIFAVGVRHSF
jgi:predicted porin